MKAFLKVASHISMVVALVSATIMSAGDFSLIPDRLMQNALVEYSPSIAMASAVLMLLADSLALRVPNPIRNEFDRVTSMLVVTGWTGLAMTSFIALVISAKTGLNKDSILALTIPTITSVFVMLFGFYLLPKPTQASQS